MRHLDDDRLALLAVDGDRALDPESALHLAGCDRCQGEASAFLDLGAAVRAGEELVPPAPAVWDRIEAELGEELRPAAAEPPAAPASGVVPLERRDRRDRRDPWPRRIAFAAAASFALGVAATAGVVSLLDRDAGDDAPRADVVQTASLEPLPGWDAAGAARVESVEGQLRLVVDLPESDVDGYREVWLLDREVTSLLSLGTMSGSEASFVLPAGLDLDKYAVVDVSSEPFDGDPAHSGDSIARGELQAGA
ncbi:anti-sigma factor [Arthrobacter halodurans]|uniref:Anti-sigma factor n=1 Tax=Arthrobacter halodurans TaxID=516699 RepID=A0ABV4UN02_9MICC